MAPRKIRKRMYENHIDFADRPAVTQITIVWERRVVPMARG